MEKVLMLVDCEDSGELVKAVSEMQGVSSVEAKPTKAMSLISDVADLTDYSAHVLWAGAADVRCQLESGMYGYCLPDDTPEEKINAICEEISNEYVDWEDDAFSDCSAGNDVISQAISAYVDEHSDCGIAQEDNEEEEN